jgi:hypothetical protein
MLKRSSLFLMLMLFCFLGAVITAAGDPISVSISSGLTSTVAGADTVSFNSGLPSGFTANCNPSSSDCGIFPSSVFNNEVHNPAGNTNDFIAPGDAGQSITINLATVQSSLGISTPINYFGLYWGSVDSYNVLDFYNGSTLVESFTGADLMAMDPSLGPGTSAVFVNFFTNGTPVTSIDLSSNGENFESVNEAFAETPEPATLALMGIGLLGVALLVRSRGHEARR